ncbi:M1 family metallopeptidase [soil metagenome]
MNPRIKNTLSTRHRAMLPTLVLIIFGMVSSAIHPVMATNPALLPPISLYEAILPEYQQDIFANTSGQLPVYDITASLTPVDNVSGVGSINGVTELDYVNFTDTSQAELFIRLYPNAPIYQEASLTLDEITIEGEPVLLTYDHDQTLASVPLAVPLAPGERKLITLAFTAIIPAERNQSYGMFGFDQESRSYNLAHWQPLIAGWTPGIGWNTGPLDLRGDPVFSNAALFSVTFTAPSELTFATTGSALRTAVSSDLTTYTWESGPSRDFVMIANPEFLVMEGLVGETVVRSFYTASSEPVAAEVLETSMKSLAYFNEQFGPYPYREFDVAEAYIGPRAAGIEFPGLVYISRNLYQTGNASLEFTIVHEVAHQWFYAIVGNNQYLHAFLDESLCNYVSILYIESQRGSDAAQITVDRFLKRSYFAELFSESGDHVVNQPTSAFPSDRAYGRIVYGKGALGMQALRDEMGLDGFIAALRSYFEFHQFGVALPETLLAEFERIGGVSVLSTWNNWFESTNGNQDFSPDDLNELR